MNFQDLINYKNFDTLRTEAFTELKALQSKITNLNVGGVFRTLLELALQPVGDFYDLLLGIIPRGYVQYADASWLALKAGEMGLTRHAASKTQGQVIFSREETSGNVVIPAGTIVATATDQSGEVLQYLVTQEVILQDGETEVTALVEAEDTGSRYNIGAGYVVNLITPISGIDEVTNDENWITTAGMDEETDEALRTRALSRWHALARGATAEAYRQWALEVPGVIHVSVDDQFPRGQGTLDVIITGSAGDPGEELITAVQALLEDRKPICSDVLVKGPVEVPVNIDLTIYKHPLYGVADEIEEEAELILNALFVLNAETTVTPLGIGDNLYLARLIKEIMKIENVLNVTITSPETDINIDNDQVITLGELNISIVDGQV